MADQEEKQLENEKKLEEYDIDSLVELYHNINRLPNFVLSYKDKNKWFEKIEKYKNIILDKVEKQHSKYSRKEKIQKWIDYKTNCGSSNYRIENDKVRDIYDPSPWGIDTIDNFYIRNRIEIEKFIDKLMFIAPLSKEQLEQLVLNEEKIYFM